MRLVLDTNVFLSAAVRPSGTIGKLLILALEHEILVSPSIFAEVERGLNKPYFQKFMTVAESNRLLAEIKSYPSITPTTHITDCRDANDNHILALALDGQADLIVTGDDDLLVLHPWRGIAIHTAAEALPMLA